MDNPETKAPTGGQLVPAQPDWQPPGYAQPPGYGQPPPGYGQPMPYPLVRSTNGMAIAALVVGLVSIFSCQLIGIVAIFLGHRARNEIRASGEDGDGMALAGIIIGWVAVGLAVLAIVVMLVYFGFMAVMFGALATSAG